ncbi:MAG: DUF4089 domain-containing protein [Burkholderiales bacterium]|nr:DUF4089 domain-containing protein [Burkholderiales bacterium]
MTREEIERYVDASAAALGLVIPAEMRPGVIANFERLDAVARAVNEFALAPDDEPGPVWRL